MKSFKQQLSFFVLCVFTSGILGAQNFEGKVTYSIEYLEVPQEVMGFESMLPQELSLSITEYKVRVQQSVMGGDQVIVMDKSKNEGFALMDMLGQKIAILMSSVDLQEQTESEQYLKYRYFEEKKMILGYECRKAEVYSENSDQVMVVWYTEVIQNPGYQMEELKGFPIQYEKQENGLSMRLTAKEIIREKVNPSLFEIPVDYERMTLEEMRSTFGGE